MILFCHFFSDNIKMEGTMLEHLKSKPHPAKAVLMRDYGLTLAQIANFLDVSYQHACNVLSGRFCTEKHEKKLWELVELAKKERSYRCDPDTGGNLTSC